RLSSEFENLENRLWVLPAAEVVDAGLTTSGLVHRVLGADRVVLGRVERENGRMKLTLELETASDRRTVQAGHETIEIASSATILPSLLARVSAMTMLPLSRETPVAVAAGSTASPVAEDAYIRGRGYLARRGASLDGAIAALERAVERDKDYGMAHAALAEAYRKQYLATRDATLLRQAQASAERAAALAMSVPYVRTTRGLVYQTTGQLERAVRELEAALAADPGAVEATRSLAEAFEQQGQFDKAEAMYRQQIVKYPQYWNAHEQLGSFLVRHGRYAEAETSLLNGVQLAPDNPRAIGNLAGVYALTERYAAAEVELERGLELERDVLAFNNLSFIYVLQGR